MSIAPNKKQEQEYLDKLRHSAAHLLAAAVLELRPEAKPTIGPSIDDGFYYDFDFQDKPISENDLPKIEQKMRELVKKWQGFERIEVDKHAALQKVGNNEFKHELIEEFSAEGKTLSIYKSGAFEDLCRGGHIENPSLELKHFKLMSVAGAYWRGSEKNKMLTRIYGTAWKSKEDLDKYLQLLEEAKKRDHRKLGKELGLYFIDDTVGKGLVMWLPNGVIVRDEIEALVKEKEKQAGYMRVSTPHIAKEELYLTSGHLPYYKDSMYPPMIMDDGTYYLKAMNCPHHHQIYLHEPRSYRDLPLRFAEYGTCYRNELSGTLAGLLRVRSMAMNDAHIYCRKDQIKQEISAVIELTQAYFSLFGLENYWFRLSKWDPNRTEKYFNEPENWEYSQNVIREVLEEMKVEYVEVDDEAAFYGPKIDVQFRSAIGREETMSTIQLDFVARKRFGLTYADNEGTQNSDVFVIHRAPLSVHERFLAFLIEHFAGAFPFWLSPLQVVVVPIARLHHDYAQKIVDQLESQSIRAHTWSDGSMGKMIRLAEKQKVPVIVVVGDREQAEQTVSLRLHGNQSQGSVAIQALIDTLVLAKSQRLLDMPPFKQT